ncbi:transglutaminase-like domain-containing protein [Gottfriedia sp. S16(2024)]|uniref:transglutaminase-like domain-containing protein n=1 Tax=Gottfriedia sp. S16(2024) TaxID=3162883 RepID=UPI003D197BC8
MITFSLEENRIQDKFLWLDYNHPYLKELRERYNLISLINDEMDDLTKVEVIMSWVSCLWEHNGENIPKHFDPLYILEQVFKGKQYRCVEYAVVLNGCLNALGLRSRILSLKTRDCETRKFGAGHVVVEIYITKMKKWIMADPQFNVVTYQNNEPLNAVELAMSNKCTVGINQSFKDGFSYYEWILPYLFYFTINFDNRINVDLSYKEKKQLMLVPLDSHYPKVFQQVHSIGDVEYTNSVIRFYLKPI